ncbi:MAG TPA: helix-turn-helix domain-containing protein [Ktedonobacteraceae bacterium]|nr:helix-turn-helix domain-containing protein [Ktedonobacteraceae bacterium]
MYAIYIKHLGYIDLPAIVFYNDENFISLGVLVMVDHNSWLTVEDIYEVLGRKVPMDTIRSWIRSKRLPAFKPGRTYLVKREDLERFLRESRTIPDDQP